MKNNAQFSNKNIHEEFDTMSWHCSFKESMQHWAAVIPSQEHLFDLWNQDFDATLMHHEMQAFQRIHASSSYPINKGKKLFQQKEQILVSYILKNTREYTPTNTDLCTPHKDKGKRQSSISDRDQSQEGKNRCIRTASMHNEFLYCPTWVKTCFNWYLL